MVQCRQRNNIRIAEDHDNTGPDDVIEAMELSDVDKEPADVDLKRAFDKLPQTTRYTHSVYRTDYESHGDRALRSESQPHTTNLKCEAGSVEGASTYVRDFVSWPEEDMELYRPQLCKPRHDLDAPMPHEKDPDISKYAPKSKREQNSAS
ncbi:hypothetical protein CEXT_461071 [Caerostris extrusa]|uniref:Uncharacterized protein n=1 Tax=Caerostris extrusa TaxID=172846 RepID=A0AAV4SEZ3_CAEEX|nr:hypothetical protein CEXT_461071 [Caerostris extrusa]